MGLSLKTNSPTLGGHRGLPLTMTMRNELVGRALVSHKSSDCSSLSDDLTVKTGNTKLKNLNAVEVIGSLDGRGRRARETLLRDNSDHGIPLLKIF